MPFELIHEGSLLLIQPSGTITRQCIAFTVGELIAAEHAMDRVLNRVTDLTRVASFDITFDAIWALAELRRTQLFPNRFRSAIVASAPLEIGFALMFKSLNDNPQIEIEIFSTMEAAKAWATRD